MHRSWRSGFSQELAYCAPSLLPTSCFHTDDLRILSRRMQTVCTLVVVQAECSCMGDKLGGSTVHQHNISHNRGQFSSDHAVAYSSVLYVQRHTCIGHSPTPCRKYKMASHQAYRMSKKVFFNSLVLSERYLLNAPLLRSLFRLSVCPSVRITWLQATVHKQRTFSRLCLHHLVAQARDLVRL